MMSSEQVGNRIHRRLIRYAAAALAVLAYVTPANAQTPINVAQLQAMKDRWPAMAEQRTSILLEGRFGARTGQLLTLQRCDLVLRLADRLRMPRIKARDNVEIVGYLKQTSKRMELIVQRISPGTSDMERLAVTKRRLPKDKPELWYAQADRIAKRAEFYADAELLKEAESIRLTAFDIEQKSIRTGDVKGLRKLAAKVPAMGLGDELRAEMLHRALRWEWSTERKKKKPDTAGFLKKLEEELAGCKEPARGRNANLKARYAKEPIKTYAESRLDLRLRCHRYFYRELLLPTVLAKLKKDNSNGHLVAAELRKLIPEEYERATELEAKQLDWRFAGIETATRSDMLDIVDLLERAGEPAKALDGKTRWVKASERRLRKRGPAGLVQSANEYDSLLRDRASAVRLLKQAWRLSPEKKEIEQKLHSYDVFRQDDRWVAKANLREEPEDPMQEALSQGRIIPGMTADQVSKSIGKPDRVVRFASARSVQIIWVYESTRLNVLMERRRSGGTSTDAKVKSVYEVPAR